MIIPTSSKKIIDSCSYEIFLRVWCLLLPLCLLSESNVSVHFKSNTRAAVSPRAKCVIVTLSVYSSHSIHISVLECGSFARRKADCCFAIGHKNYTHSQQLHTHMSLWWSQWDSTDTIALQVHTALNAIMQICAAVCELSCQMSFKPLQ